MATKLTDQQVALINDMLENATDSERDLFLYRCERSGLDPMARQIYPVFRWDKNAKRKSMSIQVSIDGYRLIAERTGQYAGQVGPVWYDADGESHDVWVSDEPPAACRVGVLRKDWSEPLWRSARYSAYVQVHADAPAGLWGKMPEVMLAKCAEALALRCAFPEDLSGLYTSDEMDESGPAAEPRTAVAAVAAAFAEQSPQRHASTTDPHPEAAKISDDTIDGDPDSFDGDRAWEAVIAHISGGGGDPTPTLLREAQAEFVGTIEGKFAIPEDDMSGRNWFDVAKLCTSKLVPF